MAICRRSSMLTADATDMCGAIILTRMRTISAAGRWLVAVTLSAAPSPEVLRVREWRGKNEGQILTELVQLLSLPNVAANRADIAKNADLLTAMFERRGFQVSRWETQGLADRVCAARRRERAGLSDLLFSLRRPGVRPEGVDPRRAVHARRHFSAISR